jgi:hypothetical protein
MGSYVAKGTAFELKCKELLSRYCFKLHSTGGKGDKGIDLKGTWDIDTPSINLVSFVQCKYQSKPISPAIIREFEGAVYSHIHGHSVPYFGLIISNQSPSMDARKHFKGSKCPLGYAVTSGEIDPAGLHLTHFVLNLSAQMVLQDLSISYTAKTTGNTTALLPSLVYKGTPIKK